jgi:hypothetical protein
MRRATLTPAERRALLLAANEIDAGEYDGWKGHEIRSLRSALRKLRGDPAQPEEPSIGQLQQLYADIGEILCDEDGKHWRGELSGADVIQDVTNAYLAAGGGQGLEDPNYEDDEDDDDDA